MSLKLLNSFNNIWKPENYHGFNKRNNFFEGWYYKISTQDSKYNFALIPGIILNKNKDISHSFIQFYNGTNLKYYYFKFLAEDFMVNKKNFEININKNYFSRNKIILNITQDKMKIKGEIFIEKHNLWKRTILNPGIMGYAGFLPLLECYYDIISISNLCNGVLYINDKKIKIQNEPGYIEKNWGKSFPYSWIWMQANNFDRKNIGFTLSIATVPYLGMHVTGIAGVLMIDDRLYKIGTYKNAKIKKININEKYVQIEIKQGNKYFDIKASSSKKCEMLYPTLNGMSGKILESLDAVIEITFYKIKKGKNEIVFKGKGINGGLEISKNNLIKNIK
jgi:hypothetical protein